MPYIGEIILFAGNYNIEGWLPCDGRELSAQQNQALYSIIGNHYGGDSKNFALPNLNGSVPVGGHVSGASRNSQGSASYNVGTKFDADRVTVTRVVPLPAHTHVVKYTQPHATVTAGTTAPVEVKIEINTGAGSTGGGYIAAKAGASAALASSPSPGAFLSGVQVTGGAGGLPDVQLTGGGVSVESVGDGNATITAEIDVRQPSLAIGYLICVSGGDYPPRADD